MSFAKDHTVPLKKQLALTPLVTSHYIFQVCRTPKTEIIDAETMRAGES